MPSKDSRGWSMEASETPERFDTVLREVLETMFFTSLLDEGVHFGDPPAGEPWMWARLSFQGAPAGVFEIGASQDAARRLAAGFLGEEEAQFSREKTGAVLCELANMLCGSFVSHLDARSIFALSTPELVESPMERGDLWECFELPEGPLTVSVIYNQA